MDKGGRENNHLRGRKWFDRGRRRDLSALTPLAFTVITISSQDNYLSPSFSRRVSDEEENVKGSIQPDKIVSLQLSPPHLSSYPAFSLSSPLNFNHREPTPIPFISTGPLSSLFALHILLFLSYPLHTSHGEREGRSFFLTVSSRDLDPPKSAKRS